MYHKKLFIGYILVTLITSIILISCASLDERAYQAISDNNVNKITEMIENGWNVNSVVRTIPAIVRASGYGHLEMVKLLVKKGANVNAHDDNNFTPLIVASYMGYPEIVSFLIDNGAQIDKVDYKGNSALMHAVYQSHDPYLYNYKYDNNDKNGEKSDNYVLIVKKLLSHKASVNIKNKYGDTPLVRAPFNNNFAIVKMLVEAGSNVNAIGGSGVTALMNATTQQNLQIIDYLLSKGANVKLTNEWGLTAPMIALRGLYSENDMRYKDVVSLYNKKGYISDSELKAYSAKNEADKKRLNTPVNITAGKAYKMGYIYITKVFSSNGLIQSYSDSEKKQSVTLERGGRYSIVVKINTYTDVQYEGKIDINAKGGENFIITEISPGQVICATK